MVKLMTEQGLTFSGIQRLMLVGQALDPDCPLYNMAFRFDLHGKLDCERFAAAVSDVVARNDCLRLRADLNSLDATIDDQAFQLPIIDASQWCEQQLAQTLKTNVCTPLDLSKHCFSSSLYRLRSDQHVWFVMKHHVATDGAAFAELQQQVVAAYQGMPYTSANFLAWHRDEQHAMTQARHQQNTDYWADKCDSVIDYRNDVAGVTELKTTTLRTTLPLDGGLMQALDAACLHTSVRSISRNLSRFSLFAAALLTLRYRLFDEHATTLGVPFAKRAPAGLIAPSLEIGFLKIEMRPDLTFAQLAKQVLLETVQGMKHISPGVSTAKTNASFSWLLNMVGSQFAAFESMECRSEWLHPDAGDAAHDLRLQIHDFDRSGRLTLHFDLNCDAFDASMRERIPQWFVSIVSQSVTNVDVSIGDLTLLSEPERKLLSAFNNTRNALPSIGLAERFQQLTTTHPEQLAVSCDGVQLNYQQLKHRVDALASTLPGEHPLPILLPRSIDFLVAVLAAVSRHVPFVPLDIDHPDNRVAKILDTLGSPVILTDRNNSPRVKDRPQRLLIEELGGQPLSQPIDNEFGAINAEDTAYIIFTSGTTGQPKGVEVAHASLNNYLHWAADYYGKHQPVHMPLFSSLAFDLTLTSLLLPIITGGSVQIYKQTDQSSQLAVLDVFANGGVDLIKLTPSHLRLVLQDPPSDMSRLSALNGLILGGEDFPQHLALSALDQFGEDLALYNEYGPTEATIGCMIHQFDPTRDLHRSVPIGVPIANSKIHLLDACGQEVPVGVPARLHISGEVLAKGYWNGQLIRGGLYDTGDQALRQADGSLVYLGRLDSQRKFRGARIELSEIEAVGKSSGMVNDIVVRIRHEEAPSQRLLCARCGISNDVPRVRIHADGVCNVCKDFEKKRAELDPYFKSLNTLRDDLRSRTVPQQAVSCLAMVSGGKDSSYMLCKLVEMGFHPVVFTLDNGYLSEHALANIERMCTRLDLHWERQCPAEMNAIFADSLQLYSNVCNGCFKTIYTLAINYAVAHNIPSIVTGLSRGQLFETRLLDMVDADVLDEVQIDQRVAAARQAYHLIDDKVSECLDVSLVRDPDTFKRVQFFDFYRYTDVALTDMYRFLGDFGDWQRPPDTGRSTNCLINDVGIYVHKTERHFHNYAIPYAWDVRMGHKTREQAVDELDDDIDVVRVMDMLEEIHYTPRDSVKQQTESLVAYYVSDTDIETSESALREAMASQLPDYAMPTHFVKLPQLPLAASGKLNELALPEPSKLNHSEHRTLSGSQLPPSTDTEKALADVWRHHFNIEFIGLDDDFFVLGGDSILAVQISASCKDSQLSIAPTDLFSSPTIRQLAELLINSSPPDALSTVPGDGLPNPGLAADELADLLGRL